MVVYPEGTITRNPDLWPMTAKSGAVRLALISGRPLFPMVQWGSHLIIGPYRKEFKLLPRKPITVVVGPEIDLTDLRERPLDVDTISAASTRLMDAMTALEAGIRGEEPPVERTVYRRDG